MLIALCALGEQTARSEGGFEVLEVKTKVDAIANGTGNDEYLAPPRFDDVLGIIGGLQEVRTLGRTLLCVLLVYPLNQMMRQATFMTPGSNCSFALFFFVFVLSCCFLNGC